MKRVLRAVVTSALITLVLGSGAIPASAGGAVFRTRPRFVEPGQLVSIRVTFSNVSCCGSIAQGPYELYVQRMRGRHGELMGTRFHVGSLQIADSRWGMVAFAKFVAPSTAGAGRYLITNVNAGGENLEEVSWGRLVIDPHPAAARRRYHREERAAKARRDQAEAYREFRQLFEDGWAA